MSALAGLGIDAGSTTCKLVAVDASGRRVVSRLEPAAPRVEEQVDRLRRDLGADSGVPAVATGYGRKLVSGADRQVTEITCHALGVYREMGHPGTLVDLGGQDSKVIRIGPAGKPVDFVMNDKCAAGTGRFLEVTAGRLGVEVTDLGERALASPAEEPITSTCTVFAESEIISLIARGAGVEAILRGLHRSLVSRLVAMIRSVSPEPPLMLSGGVALNAAVRVMISEALDLEALLPPEPQLMGAYGAALLAAAG